MLLPSEYDLAIILEPCIKMRSHNDYKNRGAEQSFPRSCQVIFKATRSVNSQNTKNPLLGGVPGGRGG
jgi:hypothetical protein